MMKQVAVGCKNWLFIGSIIAGRHAANLLTLVSSASRNDLDVWIYTKRTPYYPAAPTTRVSDPTPGRSHTPSISSECYRVEERRDRADRKQRQRADRRATKVPRPLTENPQRF